MSTTDDSRWLIKRSSQLSETEFIECYGAVYEHSAWIAQQTWQQGLTESHDTVAGLAAAMAQTLAQASRGQQLALIKAHPDLAGRAAVRGELTDDSTDEQASAGLDQCSAEEFNRFQALNEAYQDKFDFPFIMAVRGSHRHAILAAFAQRLDNEPEKEFATALAEINKIARLRLALLAQD